MGLSMRRLLSAAFLGDSWRARNPDEHVRYCSLMNRTQYGCPVPPFYGQSRKAVSNRDNTVRSRLRTQICTAQGFLVGTERTVESGVGNSRQQEMTKMPDYVHRYT